jgi:adenylate cyclase
MKPTVRTALSGSVAGEDIMKPETKILLGLAAVGFVLFVLVCCILQPNALSVAIIAGCGVFSVLTVWWILVHTISSGPVANRSALQRSSVWPQRTSDPDKLVDRLVSSMEEFMVNVRENRVPVEDTDVRQKLYHTLGTVVEQTTGLAVSSQTLEVTVLLSDLRGFSVITEGYTPRQVVDILNRYFDIMCEIIYRYGGTVDKFMGDCIMALFGAPVSREKYIEHALSCAVEMQIAMDTFNSENEKLGMPNLYMGVGINTGQVIAGKIGSNLHSEYTVIGDEVNLTSRIEAYTLRGQILISDKTYSRVKNLVRVENPIYVSVKGKHEPTQLYELLEIGEPYNLKVPEREARRSLRVEVNIPFYFQIYEGKVVGSEVYEGRILNISAGGMFICTLAKVELYQNMRFRLELTTFGVKSSDIYGKALRVKKSAELYEVNVEFTAIKPRDRDGIKEYVNQIVQSSFMPGA